MSKIYCLCPDFEKPSGGTRTLYWYMRQLCQQGYDAWIVHQQLNFRLTWHGMDVPTTSLAAKPSLEQGDVVISPEGMLPVLKSLEAAPVYKVALVLAWHPNYLTIRPNDTWEDYGVHAVLTQSEIIAQYLGWRLSLPATVVKPCIDPKKYYWDAKNTAKQPLIAYNPRKCHDTNIVRAALRAKGDRFSKFRWQSMVNLNEGDYAQCLRQAAVYVPPSNHEGINISVLEAMACGCLVVGYHGVGGKEFMVGEGPQQNCILVENGNLPELGKTLEDVLSLWQDNPTQYEAILNNAMETAQIYQDKALEARGLADFFDKVLQLPVHQPSLTETLQLAAHPSDEMLLASVQETPLSEEVRSLVQRANQLQNVNQLAAAADVYQQALALDDTVAEIWFNYGNLLHRLGDRLAIAAYQKSLTLRPNFFQAYLNLGNCLRDRGLTEEAIDCYQKAISIKPDLNLAVQNLAKVLIKLNRYIEAEPVLIRWFKNEPKNVLVLNALGVVRQAKGDFQSALKLFQKAVAIAPSSSDSLNNLGIQLRMLHRPAEALPWLEKSLAQDNSNITVQSNYLHTLLNLGKVSSAIEIADSLLAKRPDLAEILLMKATALTQQARIPEALHCLELSWQKNPQDIKAIANALFTMLYGDKLDPKAITVDREKWVKCLPASPTKYTHWLVDKDFDRPLKIGYLSADLRAHSVTFFLEPILSNHNPDAVEVFCYDTGGVNDAVTKRLKSYNTNWIDCAGWGDLQLAQKIHDDAIDVLVDLSGHTAGSRPNVLRCKPAPIQMLYIGYPSSSGLAEIDYIIADAQVVPVESEHLYTEKIARVEGSMWCYRPHESTPVVGELLALTNGYLTFGSFNNAPKLSPTTISLWSEVLKAIPDSHLLLKALAFGDDLTGDRFRQQFAANDIDPARITFEPPSFQIEEFFEAYQRIDIALDSFPFTGGTITCHSLWMGVPVITLRGHNFCSRMSHSFLTNVGLTDLSTATPADYVRVAVDLANDLGKLRQMRSSLRQRMLNSPILNADFAARQLESIYDFAVKQKPEPDFEVSVD